jgi:hypothetical protein
MMPENSVLALVLPTVRLFEPRRSAPLPATEPTSMPAVVSCEMSMMAVEFALISVARPPEALAANAVELPSPELMMIASAALLESVKSV